MAEREPWQERLDERLEEYAIHAGRYILRMLQDRISTRFESPIEKLLAVEFVTPFAAYAPFPIVLWESIDADTIASEAEQVMNTYRPAVGRNADIIGYRRLGVLFPQCAVGEYRVDMILTLCHDDQDGGFHHASVLIECDGHDFHERTKEQAQRDRARDRELQGLGFTVLRFTGAEIWRSPQACAGEAIEHFRRLLPSLFTRSAGG